MSVLRYGSFDCIIFWFDVHCRNDDVKMEMCCRRVSRRRLGWNWPVGSRFCARRSSRFPSSNEVRLGAVTEDVYKEVLIGNYLPHRAGAWNARQE